MTDKLLQLISILQTQTAIVESSWQYFSVITMGILVLIWGNEAVRSSPGKVKGILVAYVIFCIGILGSILVAQGVYIRYCGLVPMTLVEGSNINSETICNPIPLWRIALFNCSIWVTVSFVIYVNTIHKKQGGIKQNNQQALNQQSI